MKPSTFRFADIGSTIREQRKAKGFTQAELAYLLHCSETYLSRIENGARPSLEILIAIAELLELDLNALFYLENEDGSALFDTFRRLSNEPLPFQRYALRCLNRMIADFDESQEQYAFFPLEHLQVSSAD